VVVRSPETRWEGYRQILGNRIWLLWEASATAATIGYSVYAIAIPWFTFEFSSSFLVVGLVLFVEVGIYTLTFLVGPLVDRARDKRTVYLVCYPMQAAAALVLGLAIGRGFLSLPLLFGLVGVLSFLWDFTWAANNVAPRLLLSVDQLFRASGLGTLLGGATQLVGYAGGALLIVITGPSGGVFLYAVLLASAALLVIPLSIPSAPTAPARYLEDFRQGWRYFSGKAGGALRKLASAELLRGFLSTAPTVLIVAVAARVFVDRSDAYSWIFVAWVLGGIVIGVTLGEWNPRRRIGTVLVGSALTSGVFVGLAVLSLWGLALDAALWACFGAAETAYLTVFYVYLRGAYPPESIGRITSNLYLFTGVTGSAGVVVVGTLADLWPLPDLGLLIAVGFVALGLLLMQLAEVRRLVF